MEVDEVGEGLGEEVKEMKQMRCLRKGWKMRGGVGR